MLLFCLSDKLLLWEKCTCHKQSQINKEQICFICYQYNDKIRVMNQQHIQSGWVQVYQWLEIIIITSNENGCEILCVKH